MYKIKLFGSTLEATVEEQFNEWAALPENAGIEVKSITYHGEGMFVKLVVLYKAKPGDIATRTDCKHRVIKGERAYCELNVNHPFPCPHSDCEQTWCPAYSQK